MKGRAGVTIVMIDHPNALTRIAQAQLQIVVFELAIAGAAVHPARKPSVVRVDEVDLLERLQPEHLEAVVNAAEREGVGVLRPRKAVFGDRYIRDLAAAAWDADQRRAGLVVSEVGDTQDVCVFGH